MEKEKYYYVTLYQNKRQMAASFILRRVFFIKVLKLKLMFDVDQI